MSTDPVENLPAPLAVLSIDGTPVASYYDLEAAATHYGLLTDLDPGPILADFLSGFLAGIETVSRPVYALALT